MKKSLISILMIAVLTACQGGTQSVVPTQTAQSLSAARSTRAPLAKSQLIYDSVDTKSQQHLVRAHILMPNGVVTVTGKFISATQIQVTASNGLQVILAADQDSMGHYPANELDTVVAGGSGSATDHLPR